MLHGGDNSLIGLLISAVTLVVVNHLFDVAAADLSQRDINAALRKAGCICVNEVRVAMLETNGQISVVLRRSRP